MHALGAYQAKTHLPRLLQEVEAGASFTITRNGRAVARLTPVANADDVATRILELRAAIKRHGKKLSMRALIEEGRR
jgi:prevent-host-death family protein